MPVRISITPPSYFPINLDLDLKMQNILLTGFEETPNSHAVVGDNRITTKLGDLGIVMEPAKGLVQPII